MLFRNTLANAKEIIQKENRIPPIDTMNGLASQAKYNLRNAKSIEERREKINNLTSKEISSLAKKEQIKE